MREIKFRAWHKAKQIMFPVTAIGFDGWIELEPAPDSSWATHLDDVDVMQFTGLKDANGTDIYEGDILRSDGEDDEDSVDYSIEYIAPSFIRRYIQHDDDWDGIVRDGLNKHNIMSRQFYVVGNRYQNPELVELPATRVTGS